MRRRISMLAVTTLVTAGGAVVMAGAPAAAVECSPNPVVCENALPGAPRSEWDVEGIGDEAIQGFSTDISVDVGGSIAFKVDTTATAFSIDLYRLGWYDGKGARKIDSIPAAQTVARDQDPCYTDETTEIYDCGNWTVSATWTVPPATVSGVFVATLRLADGGKSHIPFIVRDDASTSKMFFQTSDTTWQAYNDYGGSNFYHGAGNGRAYKLSYNRPFATRRDNHGRDHLFSNEYPMIRFMERNGYDVSYTTGVDSDRRGQLIANHDVFVSVGHDEYWSGRQRTHVEAARDSGTHLAFFSGNEVYWKTRWEPSQDGTNTGHRTLVCYKESWADAKLDQSSPEWTGTWRDPRFSPPSNGGRPENELTGTAYLSNDVDLAIKVPAEFGKFRLWRHTALGSQSPGQVTTLAPHTIGYESDEDLDNGFRPDGLIRLSETTGPTPEYLRDFSRTVQAGTTTHHLTLYRAPSRALVFSAGTIQWAWGLDQVHDGEDPAPADTRMQQATINLFADMGVRAVNAIPGLTIAALNTDTTAPAATITSPPAWATFANGASVTLTGTATDAGGGQVAGVEVSTDGGATWHRATGTTSWSYTFSAIGPATTTVRVRAADDSANLPATPTTRTFNLTGPTTIWGNRVPEQPSVAETGAFQLGIKFQPQSDGYVTGIRFYKGAGNTGTHTGSLWTAAGARLATGTFQTETATGWQTMTFGSRVTVEAGTTYVASYLAPNGGFAGDSYFFAYHGHQQPPLVVPRDGNGVFGYGNEFPDRTHGNANYYVDVTFLDGNVIPPTVLTAAPADGTAGVPVTVKPTAKMSKPVVPSSVQMTVRNSSNAVVPGTTAYDTGTRTATFTPAANLPAGGDYTATVQAQDADNRPIEDPPTWAFRTEVYPSMNKLFPAGAQPAETSVDDSGAVSLGVKFTPQSAGRILGLRFYKGAGNTGTHTGTLWTANGLFIRRVTFTDETAFGWQTATFDTPVTVVAGTTYVLSYFAPNGHYAATGNFFDEPYAHGSMTAVVSDNGVYAYGGDLFPTSSHANTNYWVDPIFDSTPQEPPPPPDPEPDGAVTLFSTNDVPDNPNWNDPGAIEVGARFTASVSGHVSGLRFYKGPLNTGTHVGSLWSAAGVRLTQATFTGESASGWQTVRFAEPWPVTAGTTYTVSYSTTTGYYAVTGNAFTNGHDSPPLHVPPSGGAFRYGSGFPDSSTAGNFWVDPLFIPEGS